MAVETNSQANEENQSRTSRRIDGNVRDFVSTATGSDVRNQTLTDIEATPRTTGNQHGLTLLRQTIEALYPPEFADAERNHTAREATVEQAGEWVANLVERWR